MLLNFRQINPARRGVKTGLENSREAFLKILQKYILREWLWTFLAITVILLVVMIGFTFGELLSDMAGGHIPRGLLVELLLLNTPHLLATTVPLSMFAAIIWGLGRLYRDQEMAVMRASGFTWKMMLRPLFSLLIPVAAIVLVIGAYLSPLATQTVQTRLETAFRTAAEWGLKTGKFHVLQKGDLVLYVEAVEKDGRTLKNIFIQQRQKGREQVWVAEKGYYWVDATSGERFLTLENGQITEGGDKTLDFGIVRFSRNDLLLPEPELKNKAVDIEARPSKELMFSRNAEEAAEFQWRITPALAIVVLGLLAIPLSHTAPKEGRGGRIVLGILAYRVYVNVLYMGRSWVAAGSMPIFLGLWWIHGLVLLVTVLWLHRQGRVVGSP